jgi:hypothetical protein
MSQESKQFLDIEFFIPRHKFGSTIPTLTLIPSVLQYNPREERVVYVAQFKIEPTPFNRNKSMKVQTSRDIQRKRNGEVHVTTIRVEATETTKEIIDLVSEEEPDEPIYSPSSPYSPRADEEEQEVKAERLFHPPPPPRTPPPLR